MFTTDDESSVMSYTHTFDCSLSWFRLYWTSSCCCMTVWSISRVTRVVFMSAMASKFYYTERSTATASFCLSVCLSVRLRNRDGIGWNTWKTISLLVSNSRVWVWTGGHTALVLSGCDGRCAMYYSGLQGRVDKIKQTLSLHLTSSPFAC